MLTVRFSLRPGSYHLSCSGPQSSCTKRTVKKATSTYWIGIFRRTLKYHLYMQDKVLLNLIFCFSMCRPARPVQDASVGTRERNRRNSAAVPCTAIRWLGERAQLDCGRPRSADSPAGADSATRNAPGQQLNVLAFNLSLEDGRMYEAADLLNL